MPNNQIKVERFKHDEGGGNVDDKCWWQKVTLYSLK